MGGCAMSFLIALSGLCALGLLVYLGYMLFK